MRNRKIPRYAPETLERKLNPSNAMNLAVVAEVMTVSSLENHLAEPSLVSVDYGSSADASTQRDERPPIRDPGHPVPGDPEPTDPTPTQPPVGSGDPPIGGPTVPSGPGEPG